MAFPVALALGGASALASLFGGDDKEDVKEPEFFGDDLKKIEKLLQDRNEANQAGAIESIREELANSGLLQTGNLPDQITRLKAGLAGQNYGDTANLYLGELGRARDFQSQKYFADLGIANQEFQGNRESRRNSLTALGGAIGQYFGEQESDRKFNRLLDFFEGTGGKAEKLNLGPPDFNDFDINGGRGVQYYG